MKKFLCIIISLFLVLSSSVITAFADNNGKHGGKYYNANELKTQLKKYYKDTKKRSELIKEIVNLKKKYKDYSITVFVNGEEVDCEQPPVIKGNRTLIPIGPIAKALGADVQWDETTQTVTITKGDTEIVIKLGSNIALVNGVEVKLDDYVQSCGNRMMVPISFIIKVLRNKVEIDEDTDSVIIEDGDTVTVNDSTTGTGDNQFKYTGTWNYGSQDGAYMDDNHWSNVTGSYYELSFSGTQVKLYGAKAPSHGIAAISIDGGAETAVDYYAATRSDNTLVYSSAVLSPGHHTLKVRVTGLKSGSATDCYVTADRVDITEVGLSTNLALNKAAVASSVYPATLTAIKAVDGKGTTRWGSQYNDSEWIYVDLGAVQSIGKVRLKWERAYAKAYKVQVSNDASTWTDVYSTTSGDGGTDEIIFTPVNARYVRMLGVQRATQWGYSLWEFEVYTGENITAGYLSGSTAAVPTSVNLSTEGTLDWAHWGYNSAAGFTQKNVTTHQISNYTKIGNGNAAWVSGDANPVSYSWTDGTPTASAENTKTAIYFAGAGNGFQITVPADTNVRTLKVYVGAWAAKGKFEVSLSDGSALPYVEYVDSPTGISCKVFTLTFKAASSGQTMVVKYTGDTIYAQNFGNVTLQAATLQ